MSNVFKKLISKAPRIKFGRGGFETSPTKGIYFRIGMYLVGGLIIGGVIFFTGDYVAGTVLKIGNQTSQAPFTKGIGLAGRWALDNVTGGTDLSGNGKTGTAQPVPDADNPLVIGGAVGYSGVAGKATTFDGIDDYVSVPNTLDIPLKTGSFTIGAWVKSSNSFTSGIYILTRGIVYTGGNEYGFNFYLGSSSLSLTRHEGGISRIVSKSASPSLTGWNYVSVSYNKTNGNTELFLNGSSLGTGTLGTADVAFHPSWDAGYSLGANRRNISDSYSSASISDVSIYYRILSQAEITALYNNTSIKSVSLGSATTQNSLNTGLVGRWELDEMSGARDLTTNRNHGTAQGGITIGQATNKDGEIHKATAFNGAGNYVDTNYSGDLSGSGNFSVATWVKIAVGVNTGYAVTQLHTIAPSSDWFIPAYVVTVSNSIFWFRSVVLGDYNSINDGNWHYLVMVWDKASAKYTGYVDGVSIGQSETVSNYGGVNSVRIGARGDAGSFFTGSIYDVRIWNRALSQPEITALYNDDPASVSTGKTTSLGSRATQEASAFVCGFNHVTGRSPDAIVYGTVKGADGRCWLDRNLGAPAVATSATDSANYGWYYQWGRATDGHQISSSSLQAGPVTNVSPGTNTFITQNSDWSSIDSNGAIRQVNWGVNGTNNPCPVGWRIPTQLEWAKLVADSGGSTCYSACLYNSALKLTLAGGRDYNGGFSNSGLDSRGSYGRYWSSSPSSVHGDKLYFSSYFVYVTSLDHRGNGFTARCLKD
jgi:uncharacterized protein (TIGR02145 family)